MPERGLPQDQWDAYFARTQELPEPDATRDFLQPLAQGAQILDFGCGTGRWSAAFARDRPDLMIDVLDARLDGAVCLDATWRGAKYAMDFQDFRPERDYDAIWARDTLFFLPAQAMESVLVRLADALKPDGVFACTFVDDTRAAKAAGFRGISEADLRDIFARCGLQIMEIQHRPTSKYGAKGMIVPSMALVARRS